MTTMLIARPLSAIGGLMVLITLSRHLPAADYGIYFAVLAIVEILILSSNLGLMDAAFRYVSATEWEDGNIQLHGPIWKLLVCRVITLVVFSAALLTLPLVTRTFTEKYAIAAEIFPYISLIALTEGTSRYLESFFDSMLFQASSQFTLVTRTFLRLAGLGYLLFENSISIKNVICLELCAGTIGATIGLCLLMNFKRRSQRKPDIHKAGHISMTRMARFALPGYASQMLGQASGPDALKLVLGSIAGAAAIALFGYAYSIAAIAQRYMPANILSGIFRPIFVAVSRKPDADTLLSDLISVSIKLNWVFLLPAFCSLYFGAPPLLATLSGGNYPDAGIVVTWLVFCLLGTAFHLNISMYCLAKETSWPPLVATLVSVIGLPIGYFLAHHHGALGITATLGITELIWSAACVAALRLGLHRKLHLDWLGFSKLLGAAVVTVAICMAINAVFTPFWILLALLAPALFLALAMPSGAFSKREKAWLISVLPINKLPFLRPQR